MEIICYAGGRGEYPENTLEAITHCQNVNQDWRIEIDLQMTKDGKIILFHDDNLKRITDLNMAVADVTLNSIQELNAGYHFKIERKYPFRDTPIVIPTLAEVLARFPEANFLLDVHTNNRNAVTKIIDIVEQTSLKNTIVIVSKFDDIVIEFKHHRPNWVYGAPTKEVKKMLFSSFLHLDGFFPLQSNILMIPITYNNRKLLTNRVLKHVKTLKKQVWVWLHEGREVVTVNSQNQYLKLKKIGVDGVFTEYPEKLYQESFEP